MGIYYAIYYKGDCTRNRTPVRQSRENTPEGPVLAGLTAGRCVPSTNSTVTVEPESTTSVPIRGILPFLVL
eukprot:1194918-Pyramimonas_sp.AAC.1